MSPFNLADYQPVEDRLRQFWADYPDGHIETELVHFSDVQYIVKASIRRSGRESPAGTGYATESVSDRGVNATSALENCETSAIGRALANLGYAPKGSRPSREEMAKSSGGAVLKGKAGSTPPESTSGARAVQERTSVLGNKDTAKSDEGLDRSSSEQPPSARTAEPTPATASRTAVPPRAEVSRGAEVSSPPTPPPDFPNFRLPKTAETAELGGYEVKELAETVPDKLEAFLGKGWFTTRQEAVIRFHLDRVKEAAK